MSFEDDLKAIEAGLDRRDAEIARLRAEVEHLKNVHCADATLLRMRVAARDAEIARLRAEVEHLEKSISSAMGDSP